MMTTSKYYYSVIIILLLVSGCTQPEAEFLQGNYDVAIKLNNSLMQTHAELEMLKPGKPLISVNLADNLNPEDQNTIIIHWENYGNKARYLKLFINEAVTISSIPFISSSNIQTASSVINIKKSGPYTLRVELCNHASIHKYCSSSNELVVISNHSNT